MERSKKKRSLAGKLLGRHKGGKGGGGGGLDASSSTSSLDRLAFGSHQLGRDARWAGVACLEVGRSSMLGPEGRCLQPAAVQ